MCLSYRIEIYLVFESCVCVLYDLHVGVLLCIHCTLNLLGIFYSNNVVCRDICFRKKSFFSLAVLHKVKIENITNSLMKTFYRYSFCRKCF